MIRPLPPNAEIETSFFLPFGPSSSATLNGGGNANDGSSALQSSCSEVNYKKTTLLFCRGLRLVDSSGARRPNFSNNPMHEELLCSSLVMFNYALACHLHGMLFHAQDEEVNNNNAHVHHHHHSSTRRKYSGMGFTSSLSSSKMLHQAKELYHTAYEQVVQVMGEVDDDQQHRQRHHNKGASSSPSSSSPSSLTGMAGINALLDLLVMAVGNNYAQLLLIMQENGGVSTTYHHHTTNGRNKNNRHNHTHNHNNDMDVDNDVVEDGDDFDADTEFDEDDDEEDLCDEDDDEDMIRELYSQVVQLALAIQSSSSLFMMRQSRTTRTSSSSSNGGSGGNDRDVVAYDDERRLAAMLHHTANGFLFNAELAGLYPPNGAPAA